MKIKAHICTGILLSTLLSTATYADSLTNALIAVCQNNTTIKAKREETKSIAENVVQAMSGWRPRIDLNTSYGKTRTINAGDNVDVARNSGLSPSNGDTTKRVTQRNGQAEITATQNLFNGGQTVYSVQAAEAAVKAASADLLDTEQQMLLAAVKAYIDLLTKTAQIEAFSSNENFLKQTLEATQGRFTVGEETRTSVAQAEAQYLDAKAKRVQAEADLEGIKATYEKITTLRPGKLEKPKLPLNLPKSLKQLLDITERQHPAVIKARFDETAARKQIDVINGQFMPQVDLVGSSTHGDSSTRNTYVNSGKDDGRGHKYKSNNYVTNNTITLQAKMPLYEAGKIRSQKRQAAYTAEQKKVNIQTTIYNVKEQSTQFYENFAAAEAKVKFYEEQVAALKISLEGTEQEVQVGSKILLDVLNAQYQLLQAQLNLVDAYNTYYYAAYQLLSAKGELTAKALKLPVDYYDPEAYYQSIKYSW